eukprot:1559037-Pyramimonas_sp.AAC.1
MMGKLNFRVTRWLNKVLTVSSTVAVSIPDMPEGGGGDRGTRRCAGTHRREHAKRLRFRALGL